MAKFRIQARVVSQKCISDNIYDLIILSKDIATNATAGQFVNIYLNDKSKLLPRPISICEINKNEGTIRLVYRVNGNTTGTQEMSTYKKNDFIDVFGPLGNGFETDYDNVIIVGGGIGIPPMLELTKQLKGKKKVVLGYRNSELFLADEFKKYADVFVATQDGSVAIKGNVIDCIKANNLEAKIILACGPKLMLKAIKEYAKSNNIKCYVSLEERMACGVGACLACICKTSDYDSHSLVKNTRVCKDGPVFDAEYIEF